MYIKKKVIDQVGVLTIDRQDALNAMNPDILKELDQAVKNCISDQKIGVIILTGAGDKAFIAGADIKMMQKLDVKEAAKFAKLGQEVTMTIEDSPKPVIAAVNGVAAGAGASIALCCDIVLAKKSAVFVQAFSKIGLIPDSAATFFLPRIIGLQKAAGLMMTAEPISAEEACKIGMIYKAFDDDEFESEVQKLAEKLSQMPTKGIGLTKRLLNESLTSNLNEQLEKELDYQIIAGKTNDFKEGVSAFLEKRKPNFKGN